MVKKVRASAAQPTQYARGYQDALIDIKVKVETEGVQAAMQYVIDNIVVRR